MTEASPAVQSELDKAVTQLAEQAPGA
jgi:hypothetical protein